MVYYETIFYLIFEEKSEHEAGRCRLRTRTVELPIICVYGKALPGIAVSRRFPKRLFPRHGVSLLNWNPV